MSAILTAKQEGVSKLWFQTLCDAGKSGLSDAKYEALEKKSFAKPGGIYPLGNSKSDIAWKANYDLQWNALLMLYMIPKGISLSGWKWSREEPNGMMMFLEKIAFERCGVKKKDAWDPMDIVGVKKNREMAIKSLIESLVLKGGDPMANREVLNGIMIQAINDKELMPVSLKMIDYRKKEKPGLELSNDLKGRNAKLKAVNHFTYGNFSCDLEWSSYKNEWRNSNEISWDMFERKKGKEIHIQGRLFHGKDSRELPQTDAKMKGAGALYGKSAINELKKFLTKYGRSIPLSPTAHPKIPNKGQPWTPAMKQYWINLYDRLKNARIDGQKIAMGNPGVYDEGSSPIEPGFPAALDAACDADEQGLRTENVNARSNNRSSGGRLAAKLWGMEWLDRYYQLSQKNKFDAFAHQLLAASKKELPGMGPFIKVYGR